MTEAKLKEIEAALESQDEPETTWWYDTVRDLVDEVRKYRQHVQNHADLDPSKRVALPSV